ncbi:2-keto-4-pentenoate hydratase [Herbaspirillum sp. CF444]|uniref:2-keto-4-pentenoate hydratase n=1 Tax=Herbaspirillum sp. CF444 TaxID=1144319 RepID=UPI0002723FF1|nr:fumarylacetoacetate hydrolase family protein [Herbaspirillum sp. CF444]EJL90368.1 2-keto-4-pentenoate hydratase [Herbaspirillum sp. CF444]
MTRHIDTRSIASQLENAQDKVRQIAPVTSQEPAFDIAAAYEVADLIHRARLAQGAVAAGRKIGFTNAAMWTRYGVEEPVWGHMYDSTVVYLTDSQADAQGTCSLARFAEPKIEPEIALHFHKAPREDADIAQLVDCIDWIAPAFEIVQSHYPGWQFKAADTVADGGLHGMLFVGKRASFDALGDKVSEQLASCSVALLCNGAVRETGKGSNALGSPLTAMVHLIAVLAKQAIRRPIQAGEVVTTGTLTAAFAVSAGEVWNMQLEGIALQGMTLAFSD